MARIRHWQDVANAGLGAWLAASPWALGYQADTPATTSAVLAGLALLAVAVGATVALRWGEWAACLIGLWLMASPWVLAINDHRAATRNAVAVGAAVVALALWSLLEFFQEEGGPVSWRRDRSAH